MFKSAEMNASSEIITEMMDALAKALSTSKVSLLRAIGLSFELKELDDPEKRTLVIKRLSEIDSLLNTVRPWFSSDSECWYWFINEKLVAFSQTPSEIVSQYQERGISALHEWIEERKTGNFQ